MMSQRTMTLIELMIVLLIITLSTLLLLPLASESEHQGRLDATHNYATAIQKLFYNPSQTQDVGNFIKDMGRYPVLLHRDTPLFELFQHQTEGNFDYCDVTQKAEILGANNSEILSFFATEICGWNGPYIDEKVATFDGWKNAWIPLDATGNDLTTLGAEIMGIRSRNTEKKYMFTGNKPCELRVSLDIVDPQMPGDKLKITIPQTRVATHNLWSPRMTILENDTLDSLYIYRARRRVLLENHFSLTCSDTEPAFNTEYRATTPDSDVLWETIWPHTADANRIEIVVFSVTPEENVINYTVQQMRFTQGQEYYTFENLRPGRHKIGAVSYVEKNGNAINVRYSDVMELMLYEGLNRYKLNLIHRKE